MAPRCTDDLDLRGAAVALRVVTDSNPYTAQPLMLEPLAVERVGKMAVCIAPVYTTTPTFDDWLAHHKQLGFEHFYVSVPGASYLAAKHMSGGFAYAGKMVPDALRLFHDPAVTWHEYSPPRSRISLSQITVLNACIFSLRYAYEYVAELDSDEFVHFDTGRFASLPAAVDELLSARTASLVVQRVMEPVKCPYKRALKRTVVQRVEGDHVFQDNVQRCIREGCVEACRCFPWHKLIMRPEGINVTYVHFGYPVSGWNEEVVASMQDMYIRHVRCISWGSTKHEKPAIT